MAKFQPRDRSGKPIRNYRKRHEFIMPGCPSGVKVPGSSSEDLEKALKIFKRQLKDTGTMEELRDRRNYIKPSKVKMVKMEKAIRMQAKQTRWEKRRDKNHIWTAIIDGKAV
jgi:small subunit ribosomal protein S21